MQDAPKAVWGIPYVSVAFFFSSLKQDFIAYRSSKVLDCIFEIHQLWQSDFSKVYSDCCCSCSFEPEIIKIGQSSHKRYSNNILNFYVSTTILNSCTKKVWKPIVCISYMCTKQVLTLRNLQWLIIHKKQLNQTAFNICNSRVTVSSTYRENFRNNIGHRIHRGLIDYNKVHWGGRVTPILYILNFFFIQLKLPNIEWNRNTSSVCCMWT